MTKNEYKDKLLKKLDDFFEDEIAMNTSLKKQSIKDELWYSVAQYDNYNADASCIKHKIMKIVSDYFNDNEIETDNSPYKEMWEKLKKRVASSEKFNSGEEEKALGYKLYHLAYEYKTREEENHKMGEVMKAIEYERGIEQ